MTDTSKSLERGGRRGRRRLSPVQKYEAFVQVLTGEMTVVECADHWGVDRSTIMRAREVAKKGALDALASSRLGTRAGGVDPELVMARAEPGGWSPPTRCCVGTGAASSGTGPNHSDRRADRRRQLSFADSHCASQPRIRPGDTAASTAN